MVEKSVDAVIYDVEAIVMIFKTFGNSGIVNISRKEAMMSGQMTQPLSDYQYL